MKRGEMTLLLLAVLLFCSALLFTPEQISRTEAAAVIGGGCNECCARQWCPTGCVTAYKLGWCTAREHDTCEWIIGGACWKQGYPQACNDYNDCTGNPC